MNSFTLRKTVISTALKTLHSTGLFSLAASSQRRSSRLLILCYHGLSLDDENEWLPELYITPEQFRQRLECLRQMKASVLPLDEALNRLHTGSLPPRSVAITFDDGLYDFLHHGVPLLSEFGYPCTLYLTTYYCQYKLPVITLILDYLLWKSRQTSVELPEQGIEIPIPIRNHAERAHVVASVLSWMAEKRLSTPEKDDVARQIATRLNIDYEDLLRRRILQIVSMEEARQVWRAGVDLQLHTHRHRTPHSQELFCREIRDNSDCIEDLTGRKPVHFCYPSGRYLPEFLPWLRELGVKSATTCETGLARRDSGDLTLPRVLDDATVDPVRFEGIVSGLFT